MTASLPTQTTILQPKDSGKRIQVIDILRGFSILGILMVNLQVFLNPDTLLGVSSSAESVLDQIAEFIIIFFAEGKFYTLLSLLFGIGFALQFNRAKAKGQNPIRFFPRRLLVLLLFGILHSILLWDGDILTLYAVMGLVLLFFRETPSHKLFGAAIVLLVIATILLALLFPFSLFVDRLIIYLLRCKARLEIERLNQPIKNTPSSLSLASSKTPSS